MKQNLYIDTSVFGGYYDEEFAEFTVQVKHYKTNACNTCPAKDLCTRNPRGRLIERSEHAPYIEQNKQNIAA